VWTVVGILLALLVAVSLVGLLLDALRWLLGVAVILALIAAVVGALARKTDRS
jgi:hypothetical protein